MEEINNFLLSNILVYNEKVMQSKSSFVIVLLVLIGLFGFIMFSPRALKNKLKDTGEAVSDLNDNTSNMENSTNPVVIEILKEGLGDSAVLGNTVTVSYVGTLLDKTEFDKSANHGDGKFSFVLGSGQVIRGWDEGIVGMKVGEKRRLTIAPEYGYGSRAIGNIPANSTLVFEVELFEIKK